MKYFGLVLLAAAGATANAVREVATADAGKSRDGKLFSVFQIVKFNNDACTTASGTMGTCYTESECTNVGGTKDGTCASGFGVCCAATVTTCSSGASVARLNNSYIANPGYPSDVATGSASCSSSRQATTTYTYTIQKFTSSVEQIRLDFLDFQIDSPSMGSCANSTLSITGVDSVTSRVLPSNLCGVLTNQHLYLSVKDTTGNITVTINLNSAGTQKWNILVRQYESSQTDYLAPRGCLQYFRSSSGTIETMNFNSGNGELLTDHMYTACIAQESSKCDVSMTASTFMLGGTSGSCAATDDKIVLGPSTFCGSTFGTSNAYNWAYSGSYMINIMTGSTNSAMNDGFSISFLLLPC